MSDFWDDWTDDPNQSGIPPSDDDGDIYMEMSADMDILADDVALDMLWAGWFDNDLDADSRAEARDMFFDYMDMDPADFDWDAWREYYEG